ncbi:MAG: 3-phosphoserine/phosphohydroxythreonine transaminase [Dehalococcoidia bacterium]
MVERVYNFAAGPATLPLPVLEEAQRDLLALPETGMSVLEMSHRSKTIEGILETAEADLRRLAGIPDNYHIMFIQGGASLQFSMIPMNLVPAGGRADHVVSGNFAKLALQEAQKVATVNVAGSTESENFVRVPRQEELTLDSGAAYLHITVNNTIFGTEWKTEPETGEVPLVGDASSNIFSKPLDVTKYGLIYAGAQKNLGAAGVTLVIIRDDLLERSSESLPAMLNYNTYVKSKSAYNTPPVFAVYILGLVVKWLLQQGGLDRMAQRNENKAQLLYDVIDASEFYRGHALASDRSLMNVTFRLPTEELETQFVNQGADAGLYELRGHRSVGGIRASLYNAFPKEGVEVLASFMREFERSHG